MFCLLDLEDCVWRYERKFFLSFLDRHDLEMFIRYHPAMFREIFHERTVNNLYFDTPGNECFLDNISGNATRIKIRIRWYGDLFGNQTSLTLELKIKKGMVGTKISYPLGPVKLNPEQFTNQLTEQVQNSENIPERLKVELLGWELALLNRYNREYFQSVDGRFRLTLDCDLEYFNIRPKRCVIFHTAKERTKAILEIKYGVEYDIFADHVTNVFPYRLSKFSKFIRGVSNIRS